MENKKSCESCACSGHSHVCLECENCIDFNFWKPKKEVIRHESKEVDWEGLKTASWSDNLPDRFNKLVDIVKELKEGK